MTMKCSDSS